MMKFLVDLGLRWVEMKDNNIKVNFTSQYSSNERNDDNNVLLYCVFNVKLYLI